MRLDARGLTLVISDKPDVERDAVAEVWSAAAGEVLRLGRFWDPPPLDPGRARVYGADSFCQVLAQKIGLVLVSPPDDLLLHLAPDTTRRALGRVALAESGTVEFPAFLKSLTPKLIPSRVYLSAAELADAARGLDAETPLLVSEIVTFVAEARSWLLDGEVLSIACYEGEVDLASAWDLAAAIGRSPAISSPCVVDLGLTDDRGWVAIEANAAWGAGLNGCDPVAAARYIARATRAAVK
jgi:ATP-grasp domain, R2K clade family 2